MSSKLGSDFSPAIAHVGVFRLWVLYTITPYSRDELKTQGIENYKGGTYPRTLRAYATLNSICKLNERKDLNGT